MIFVKIYLFETEFLFLESNILYGWLCKLLWITIILLNQIRLGIIMIESSSFSHLTGINVV